MLSLGSGGVTQPASLGQFWGLLNWNLSKYCTVIMSRPLRYIALKAWLEIELHVSFCYLRGDSIQHLTHDLIILVMPTLSPSTLSSIQKLVIRVFNETLEILGSPPGDVRWQKASSVINVTMYDTWCVCVCKASTHDSWPMSHGQCWASYWQLVTSYSY